MKITEREKIFLLNVARESIRSWVSSNSFRHDPDLKPIISIDRPAVFENMGAFVTLRNDGELRGCIGLFNADYPLYLVVRDMAISAATKDTRFRPVSLYELNNIDIEISVLTPNKQINSIDEFILGQHGIYMIKEGKSGTFLPQVANETGWTKEEFLGHCSQDKMGMRWEDWKSADLYIYEAIVFTEKQFGMNYH
jgi:AmmeMemoRadiSam system protein A